MTDPFARLRGFLRELKRRNVYKVAVTYAAVTFIGLQAVRLLVPATTLPGWADELLIAIAVLGFPIAIVLAWAFEMTPEGMRRTEAPEGEELGGSGAYQWIGLAVVVLLGGGVWYATTGDGGEAPTREAPVATDTAEAGPTVSDRSIAVLPFDNLSGTEEAEPFANGLHDDLLTRLSNISELKVISRTSVLPYRQTELSLPAIADSLGVSWIVEGGVQQAGDQVQVNAQLIQAEDDAHEWAETYRRELTTENLFAVQSDLTRKIARSLQAELSAEERTRVERSPTTNLKAYQLYSRGRNLLGSRSAASIDSARRYFDRALRQDSSFALAWVGLADAQVLSPLYHIERDFAGPVQKALPEARAAARRALELDPDLAEAHASLGLIYFTEHMVKPDARRTRAALEHLKRAVQLKPSYAEAHHWLGIWLMRAARPDSALKHLRLAVELNPRNPAARRNLTDALISNRRYEEALFEAQRFREMHPDRETGPALEAAALLHLKRWDELRRVAGDYVAQTADTTRWAITYLALADVARGDTASARMRLKLLRRRKKGPDPFPIYLVEAALRNPDAALAILPDDPRDVEFLVPRSGPQELRFWYPDYLQPLSAQPAYRELVRKINQQWGLNPDGSLPDSVAVSFNAQPDE